MDNVRPDRFESGRHFALDRKRLLGMPLDARAVRVGPFDLEGRLNGYSWELFGLIPDDPGDGAWPAFDLLPPPSTPGFEQMPLIQVWQQLVHCPGTLAYVEMRWSPVYGRTISLHGLEHETRKAQLARAMDGILALRRLVRAGRPVGSGRFADADDFVREVREVVNRLRRDQWRITQVNVAGEMFISASALRENLARFGLAWADLRNYRE